MNDSPFWLTAPERRMLADTVLVRRRLEEQYHDLPRQTETAAFGMWLFLATEVMFFGTLFLVLAVYRYQYPVPFEKASEKLKWTIGASNTLVLLLSSLTMALAVHFARLGKRRQLITFLLLTALLGSFFLSLKGYEYYLDYRENLLPGFRFDPHEWVSQEGLSPAQVPQVTLFLMMYWIMTATHALHMTIGIAAVLTITRLAWNEHFSAAYNSPVDVVGLYWHFVDIVWIFLLPMLYLLGTHHW